MKSPNHFYYEQIVRTVLVELRGKLTQKAMSQLLGYKYNQWHKWESGQKKLLWSDFIKIKDKLNIKINDTLSIITDSKVETTIKGSELFKNIIFKYGGLKFSIAQKKLGISKSTLNRMLSSKKDIEVAFIFQCLGELSSSLPFLLGAIVKNFQSSSLQKMIMSMNRQVQLEADFPWISLIEAYLVTTHYKKLKIHDNKKIADFLGLSEGEVKFGLERLLENKAIEKTNNKYRLIFNRVDLEVSISDSARFALFWSNVCAKRYQTEDFVPLSRRGWSSRVFPISEQANEKFLKLRQKFISDMYNILQDDSVRDKTKIQVFMMHCFDQDEIKQLNVTKFLQMI